MFDIPKHRLIMGKILKDIYSNFELSAILGLKGGTALYIFYKLPRFSIDLDFDLIDNEKKDLVYKKIKAILSNHGKLKDIYIKKNTILFILSYGKDERNLKIEISSHRFPNEYEAKQYLGLAILVLKVEYMFSHKLVALTERDGIATRDIFDIWFFLKQGYSIKEDIIKLRTNLSLTEYIPKCIELTESVNSKSILQGIGELLDPKQKSWVKKNLIKEVIFLLKFYLDEFEKARKTND